jgi:RNA polymerase sigma-70 factor (ECF subfamily)
MYDLLSQISSGRRYLYREHKNRCLAKMNVNAVPFNIETAFRTHYGRVARIIARVVRDHARAEELAVEVFLKLWRTRNAQADKVEAWLYRVAVRTALDELRGRTRRAHYESLFGLIRARSGPPRPGQIHRGAEVQERVRLILSRLEPRHAEFLILRSHGFSYEELASIWADTEKHIRTLLDEGAKNSSD